MSCTVKCVQFESAPAEDAAIGARHSDVQSAAILSNGLAAAIFTQRYQYRCDGDKEIKANKCHFDVTTNYTRLHQISFPLGGAEDGEYPGAPLLMGASLSRRGGSLLPHYSLQHNCAQGARFPSGPPRLTGRRRTAAAYHVGCFFFRGHNMLFKCGGFLFVFCCF